MDEHRPPTPSKPTGIPRLSRLPLPRAARAEPLKDPIKDGSDLPSRDLNVSRIRSKHVPNSVKGPSSVGPCRASRITAKTRIDNNQDASDSLASLAVSSSLGHNIRKLLTRPPARQQDATNPMAPTIPEPDEDPESLHVNQENYLGLTHPKSRETIHQRRPRPSLSERTIETLSQIPPSPSPHRRKSSFFTMDSPMRPPSRRASALNRSRPTSSMGQQPPNGISLRRPTSPSKHVVVPHTGQQLGTSTPSRRTVGSLASRATPNAIRPESTTTSSPSIRLQRPNNSTISSATGNGQSTFRPLAGSKTYSARSSKPRPSLSGILAGPRSSVKRPAEQNESCHSDKLALSVSDEPLQIRSTTSRISRQAPRIPVVSDDTSSQTPGVSDQRKASTTSAALRKTIAEAKAARRAAIQSNSSPSIKTKNSGSAPAGFAAVVDPFDTDITGSSNSSLLRKRIDAARTDGRLNVAAMALKSIPEEVMKMYDIEALNTSAGAWYESVDLTRFIAADNEIEEIGDDIFPDVAIGANEGFDDEQKGNQFGGLETLDLHGNRLKGLPCGLRRLEHLTTLNVSSNRLSNDSVEIVAQVSHLRELRCANNALEGMLSESVCNLSNLEVLEVHDNALSELPDSVSKLTHLRILKVSGNQLASLPFAALAKLRLIELIASKNRLKSALLPPNIDELPTLQALDVSNNALTSLTEECIINMPSLQYLNVAVNRLTSLPRVTGWTKLLTLNAEDNKLTSFPDDLLSFKNLKNVNFTGNSISKVDPRIGLMESLSLLRIGNNPLRERRFLTMNTEDLKQELRERLDPEKKPASVEDEATIGKESSQQSPAWSVKAGGILDRSNTGLHTLDAASLEAIIASNDIRSLMLHHNPITQIPTSVAILGATLTTLDLSHSELRSDVYMTNHLSLPTLRSLDLSSNTISTVTPLLTHLSAPLLSTLTISYNRLTILPPLRRRFPHLTTLLASDNAINSLSVDAVKGLHTLDVARNDIGHLEPKLGLLAGELKSLLVGGNRFKVPRYIVLDKGTEATLEWLRGRIPVGGAEGEGLYSLD